MSASIAKTTMQLLIARSKQVAIAMFLKIHVSLDKISGMITSFLLDC